MSKALVFLAEGFEEVEALTPVDLLRRAKVEVTTVSIGTSLEVTGRSGITVKADVMFADADPASADLLILPGGQPGTNNLMAHSGVEQALKTAAAEDRLISAICAAPMVLGHHGLLEGRKAACYPGCESGLTGAEVCYDDVVIDGKVVTSRGAGTAMEFALSLIACLEGNETSEQVRKSIVSR